jgi:4-amino-4-deoxy-L-arabinose transferase-like glycosyltransferase
VLLTLWVLSYLVPLSFGVSKVANFILPILPAVILLVGFAGYDLLQSERWTLLYLPIGTLLLVIVLYSSDILHFRTFVNLDTTAGHRFLFLGVSLGIMVVLRFLFGAGQVLGVASPRVAVAMIVLICISVFIQNSKKNWDMSNMLPANYDEQMALKTTADRIKSQMPQGAVVLVEHAHIRNAHLYFQYWSGFNSLPAQQLAFAKRTLSSTHPLYILVKDSLADATLIEKVPYGYLYRIN